MKPILALDPDVSSPEPALEEPHFAYARCKKHRDVIADRYDEATRYAFPGRAGISGSPDAGDAWDDTAVVAAGEFTSRIQAGVTPNFARWASHVAGIEIEDEDEKKEINAGLQEVDEFVFTIVNASNFQSEANECYHDLALGTMGMRVDEQDEANPIVTRAIPLSGLVFGIGPDGRPDPIAEERRLSKRDARVIFPDGQLPDNLEDKEHLFVEIWQRDWDQPAAERYRCTVFLPGNSNAVVEQYTVEGPGSCKMVVARWSKGSGEVWGRGPLFNILPSMRLVNYAMKGLVDHAELHLAGIWSAEDDGVLNPETVRLEPGTLIPRAPGSAPLQNVVPAGSFDITQFMIEEHRLAIKKALYTEQLGRPDKTPMSATEVDQRMAELSRAVGAPFGRIVLEFVLPFVTRAVRILKDRKMIALPKVDGKQIKLIATSPLAQSQRFDDIDRTTKWAGTVSQLFGPEAAALTIDTTEASLYLGDRYGVPEKLSRPRKKQAELSAQIAQAAQGGMNGGEAAGAEGAGPGLPA